MTALSTNWHRTAAAPCHHDRGYLHHDLWAFYYAFREGPMLREALDVIADKARHEAEASSERARKFTIGSYDRVLNTRRASSYREVRRAAIALKDHLDGHEGFDDARDELETALEVL